MKKNTMDLKSAMKKREEKIKKVQPSEAKPQPQSVVVETKTEPVEECKRIVNPFTVTNLKGNGILVNIKNTNCFTLFYFDRFFDQTNGLNLLGMTEQMIMDGRLTTFEAVKKHLNSFSESRIKTFDIPWNRSDDKEHVFRQYTHIPVGECIECAEPFCLKRDCKLYKASLSVDKISVRNHTSPAVVM